MSLYFSDNNYQAPAVYVEIMNVQLGLSEHNQEYQFLDISEIRPRTPKSISKYPNIVESIDVERITDGDINIYTLVLKYAPDEDEDVSYVDKLISANRTHNGSKLIIAYGDSSGDGFFSTKKEAMILSYKLKVEQEASAMRYEITAISTCGIYAYKDETKEALGKYPFPEEKNTRVSAVIRKVYQNPTYHLRDIFPGGIFIDGINVEDMNNDNAPDLLYDEFVIAGGDYSPVDYLKYLAKLMSNRDIGKDSNYSYSYSYNDDMGAQSFHIDRSLGPEGSSYIDELKIGTQDSNVIAFEFLADHVTGMVVDYAKKGDSSASETTYYDRYGQEHKITYSPSNKVDGSKAEEELERDRRWWNTISQIPYTMTCTARGLKRQIPLMTCLKVTYMVKGQAHFLSGLFYATSIKDHISSEGFTCELEMVKKV